LEPVPLGSLRSPSEHTAVADGDAARRLAVSAATALHLLHNTHSLDHLSEYNVLAIEMGCRHGGDKKLQMRYKSRTAASWVAARSSRAHARLAAVGVGPRIRHGKQAPNRVLVLEVLVGEFGAVYALATGSIVVGEVATLKHKAGDDAVKAGALVSAIA